MGLDCGRSGGRPLWCAFGRQLLRSSCLAAWALLFLCPAATLQGVCVTGVFCRPRASARGTQPLDVRTDGDMRVCILLQEGLKHRVGSHRHQGRTLAGTSVIILHAQWCEENLRDESETKYGK